MSELEKRQDYSRYDCLTTVELQEILRKHAHNELETEPDTQELFEIMEVLSSRREKAGFPAFHSDEEAFSEFCDHYMPQEKEDARQFPHRTLKTVAAVLAIVLVLAVGTTMTTKAFHIDIWSKLANWSKELFQFANSPQNIIAEEPEKEYSAELKSLQDALMTENITEELVPTWLPEGYKDNETKVSMTPKGKIINANYIKGDMELVIHIRQTIGTPAKQVEKSDDLLEVYVVDGIEYYIFSNNTSLQTAWSIGEFECIIGGTITLDEMKKMINSI